MDHMDPEIDTNIAANDIEDCNSITENETFKEENNESNDHGENNLSNSDNLQNSDFSEEYAHLEEFFKFETSKPRQNGIYTIEFSCMICLPKTKVLKSTTLAPMSNLRAHLKKKHSDLMCQFKELLRNSRKRTRRKKVVFICVWP